MTDQFFPTPLPLILKRILSEFKAKEEVLGLPKGLFINPTDYPELTTTIYGRKVSTPYGVAAGPHTQLCQNIVASWLFGARYIELKTIQTLDEINLSKPCIDMQDEGYNCEWSQELKIHESFDEYLNAWIIIHVLNHYLKWDNEHETIFNMSVGYDLDGIMKPNVQWFFDKMKDCTPELNKKIDLIRDIYPEIEKVTIPAQLSDNITLSTMHGCPANEIESIAKYLIEEKKLHTRIKLNPTLLGADSLRKILNINHKWPVQVPDQAFEHDLKYEDALSIIKNLELSAEKSAVHFGLKLTNTLEVKNQKDIFIAEEKMAYLSGRALHPLSVNVAANLQSHFQGRLDISFSGGIDAFNISEVLDCGMQPITISSDLLKPGGYSRMHQYAVNIQKHIKKKKQEKIPVFSTVNQLSYLQNLMDYSQKVIHQDEYSYHLFAKKDIKTQRKLNAFDCISAPCIDSCPTSQNIPTYLNFAAQGKFQEAFEVILQNNAFPQTLGLVCEHNCQSKCTRIGYDNSVQIREIKNFVSQNGHDRMLQIPKSNGLKVAIIGAGPAGLSAAYFLALEGFEVTIFEKENAAGGLVHKAIPSFRMPNNALYEDIARIESLGVKINYQSPINQAKYNKLKTDYQYVYVAIGAQNMKTLGIPGADNKLVLDSLDFLAGFKDHSLFNLGEDVIVIGGGNTAMDVARAANKMLSGKGKVSIVYRRSLEQMPADAEEIMDAKAEGIQFFNLLSPLAILSKDDGFVLQCDPMELTQSAGSDGRLNIRSKNLQSIDLKFSTLIPAIGQMVKLPFTDRHLEKLQNDSSLLHSEHIFHGGDVRHGAASIVQAVGDGQNMAKEIIRIAELEHHFKFKKIDKNIDHKKHLTDRSKRIFGLGSKELLSGEEIKKEASRCLSCDDYCNICVSVCPNRANYSYLTKLKSIPLQRIHSSGNEYSLGSDINFIIRQELQILNIADYCNECGNCTSFCPTSGAPFKEKPHFYLSKESFNKNNEGYCFDNYMGNPILYYKNDDGLVSLKEDKDQLIFVTRDFEVDLEKESLNIQNVKIKTKEKLVLSLYKAAEMSIILQGAKALNELN